MLRMGEKESSTVGVTVARGVVLDDLNRVHLLKRVELSNYHGALWETPGGKIDDGESFAEALEREIYEETGLNVARILPREFDYRHESTMDNGKLRVTEFSLMRVVSGRVRLRQDEHSAHALPDYPNALGYDLTPEGRKALIHFGATILSLV